jgi:hypothetical protein
MLAFFACFNTGEKQANFLVSRAKLPDKPLKPGMGDQI